MATSAIGPGFLTQTAVFTGQLAASFGFVILASVVLDLGAQLNIWRVIAVSGRRAQDIANDLLPGLGHMLAGLVAIGGLAFNVGNVAGAGLGLNAMTGIPVALGAAISAAIAVALFAIRDAGRAMDRFVKTLGIGMLALTACVAVMARPPLAEAALRSVAPERIDLFAILTLVGGTVGGYITFAGGHRLIDAGVCGIGNLPRVMRAATTGIIATGAMRVLLFLAALGVVARGLALDAANPPASVFRLVAGESGYRLFGLVMWAAATTSIVGASFTSVSFLRTLSHAIARHDRAAITAFILFSTGVFLFVGRPVQVLIVVGALNGLILPLGLGVMLVAAHRRGIVGEYRHPLWLTAFGGVTAALTVLLAVRSLAAVYWPN
jgi:Mn2+/Fe2+ NRAMP family transporter